MKSNRLEEDINTDLHVLQSHLDGMLDRVQFNSLTLKRFQVFEMRLLNLNSLAEMIDHILDDARTFFDLDVISFCLIDEKSTGHDICYFRSGYYHNFWIPVFFEQLFTACKS